MYSLKKIANSINLVLIIPYFLLNHKKKDGNVIKDLTII